MKFLISENLEIERLQNFISLKSSRGRAWRRFQQRKHHRKANCQSKHSSSQFCLEKNWSLMYGRKEKMYRAKKLGFTYPFGRDEIHCYNV